MPVVIHLGGEKPSRQLAGTIIGNAELVIAADSGFDLCQRNGLVPNIVTGDFDSIEAIPKGGKITVVPAKEQNATDFEKALRLVPDNARQLIILGGTGLRSDHFLTNLLIASAEPLWRSITFIDDLQSIFRVTADCPFAETVDHDTIVSLIPFSDCTGVTTEGLRWNLTDEVMGPGKQLGQSNRSENPDIAVQIGSGRLFVVINRNHC